MTSAGNKVFLQCGRQNVWCSKVWTLNREEVKRLQKKRKKKASKLHQIYGAVHEWKNINQLKYKLDINRIRCNVQEKSRVTKGSKWEKTKKDTRKKNGESWSKHRNMTKDYPSNLCKLVKKCNKKWYLWWQPNCASAEDTLQC